MVVLHLSDLHFGAERASDVKGIDERNICLSGLIDCISSLSLEWQPKIICISGDLGYAGKESDYTEASIWLNKLLDATGLYPKDIVICPGNHDVDRNIRGIFFPPNAKAADESLALPIPDQFLGKFKAFSAFCESFGIPPMTIHENVSYLIGAREINNIQFVVLNSAWFCQGNEDKGNLWVGLPHIIALEKDEVLDVKNFGEKTRIVLVHHPRKWLHDDEHEPYAVSTRKNTFDYLAKRCEIILTGHTHSALRDPDQIASSAWHLAAGASYDNAGHFNNFSLIRIESEGMTLKQFEFDPRCSNGQPWEAKRESFFSFNTQQERISKKKDDSVKLVEICTRIVEYARREQMHKSRAIEKTGELPQIISRNVSVFLDQEHYLIDSKGLIKPHHSELREPIIEAVQKKSKALLLAELGSGKSTIATQLVIELIEKENQLALYIPAGYLKGCSFEKVSTTLDDLSYFISNNVLLNSHEFNIRSLLQNGQEVTLVVDGLDELEQNKAKVLLKRLSDLVDDWINLRVLATGRPIELLGLDYSKWQMLGIPSLRDDERFLILYNEARSNGMNHEEAELDARTRLAIINKRGDLTAVASTPLALRLLYPRLKDENLFEDYTIGNLLFDLIEERLNGWSKRVDQPLAEEEFEKVFPSGLSRFLLLGQAANEINSSPEGYISKVALESAFYERFITEERKNPEQLASQTVSFLLRHILKEDAGFISFPVQPLFECALARYYLDCLKKKTDLEVHWRVASFMGTLARNLNRVNEYHQWFNMFISKLLCKDYNFPGAAMIVVEVNSHMLATETINCAKSLGFRPISLFHEDQSYSAQCIAKTITLAGDMGFTWFHDQYLDPSKPTSERTLNIAASVFSAWARNSSTKLSPTIRNLLVTMVPPYSLSTYYKCKDILAPLALLIPELFMPSIRAELYASALSGELLRDVAMAALRRDALDGFRTEVLNELKRAASIGYENSGICAYLWLELSNDSIPPIELIKVIAKGAFGRRKEAELEKVWPNFINKYGEKRLKQLLKSWLISEDDELACVSSYLLYEMGESDWYMLAPPFIRSLKYDGNTKAEMVLENLISDGGQEALHWLVQQFDPNELKYNLPGPGYWRVLLKQLKKLEIPNPSLLCMSVAAINDYILSRYPEIRKELRELIKNEPQYLNALHKQLRDIDPKIRKRVACVLITVDPNTEIEAAEIVLDGEFETGIMTWEDYFQRLRFGPAVLTHLKNSYMGWGDKAKTLSLLLLYRNDMKLSCDEWDFLISRLLMRYRFLDKSIFTRANKNQPVLADEKAFNILYRYFQAGGENAEQAASALLEYHISKLSKEQLIRCKLLSYNTNMFFSFVDEERKKIMEDPEYLALIEKISAEIVHEQYEEPLLSLISKTTTEITAWKKFVWILFFSKDDFASREGYVAEWLYKIAVSDSNIMTQVAQSVFDYIDDERINEYGKQSSRDWLVLLGNCFGTIDKDHLISYFNNRNNRYDSIVSICFAARTNLNSEMKKIPSNEKGFVIHEDKLKIYSQITQILLPSEEIHPNFFSMIEHMLYTQTNLPDNKKAEIVSQGKWGKWFVILLNYYMGESIDLKLLASLTGDWIPYPKNQNEAVYIRMNKAMKVVYRHVEQNQHLKDSFINELRSITFNEKENDRKRYALLLKYNVELSDSELLDLFECIASSKPGFNRPQLIMSFYTWIIKNKDSRQPVIVDGLEKGIHTLSNHKPRFSNDALVRILLPTMCWVLGLRQSEASIDVFLYGLHNLLIRNDHERDYDIDEVFNIISPIWSELPPNKFENVIQTGLRSHYPDIKALCSLFSFIIKRKDLEQ